MTNATENKALALNLRVDLANAALAYANRCVDYALDPSADTKEAMFDTEALMMELVNECRDTIEEYQAEALRERVYGWESVTC